ncbi:hypothetical protein LSAT2_009927 [Lamellibrachia satsuma]|nr:hypothetical protein LSAT2_009927 [Lamellibrachia satsuma]
MRLDTFILSIGDSPDRHSHTQCASHNGRVAAAGTVEEQCNTIARYLSFRRDEGYQSYASGLCEVVVIGHRYVDIPYFESSDKPEVDVISSSSMKVMWPKAKNIPSSLDTYYHYIVWLQADEKTYMHKTKQPQTSNTDRFESHIAGLQFNTHYSVKVEPYRQQNELREAGTSTGVTRFKTTCIAPDIPVMENVTMSTQNGSTNGNINVSWKTLNYSGCDQIEAVVVFYKLQNNNTWQHKEVERVTDTQLTLYNVNYDVYEVKVSATNNEDITSTSVTFVANFLTKVNCGPSPAVSHAKAETTGSRYLDRATYTCESGYYSDGPQNHLVCGKRTKWEGDEIVCRAQAVPTSQAVPTAQAVTGGLGTGPWIGIAVAAFILGGVFMTVVQRIIFRMRSNNEKADNEERQIEQPPIEMGAGAIGGVPDYDHLTRVPGEQERPNVYDVIPVYHEIST